MYSRKQNYLKCVEIFFPLQQKIFGIHIGKMFITRHNYFSIFDLIFLVENRCLCALSFPLNPPKINFVANTFCFEGNFSSFLDLVRICYFCKVVLLPTKLKSISLFCRQMYTLSLC